MNREDEIIKAWGTPEQYFKELEAFIEKHKDADYQTFDQEKCLVSVVYMFKPYQVWEDNEKLKEAIREANKNESQS